jgi:DNA polymerase I-like protein with 3'-5' exonuclease and polymerase domains
MSLDILSDAIILDLETTIAAPKPHFGATPNWPANKIVAVGTRAEYPVCSFSRNWLNSTTRAQGERYEELSASAENLFSLITNHPNPVLVGHNIGFDLQYLMRMPEWKQSNSKPPRVWDTMKFHHIQRSREAPNPSLEKVAQWWKIPFKKDTEVKERFKMGIGADQIDTELLYEYLSNDVLVTAEIFKLQHDYCNLKGTEFTAYILDIMASVLVTTQMSCTGIKFDTQSAQKETEELQEKLEALEQRLKLKWEPAWPQEAHLEFNPNSPAQVEALLWGSEAIKTQYNKVVLDSTGKPVKYKTGKKAGKIKTKLTSSTCSITGLIQDSTRQRFDGNDWECNGSAQVLNNIIKYDTGTAKEFAEDILELRELTKSISTYFKPYIEYAINDTIHPNFNHCVAQTGRLTSAKPNMQNISGKGESL